MKKIFVSLAVAAGLLVGGVALAAAPAATSTGSAMAMPARAMGGMGMRYGMMPAGRTMASRGGMMMASGFNSRVGVLPALAAIVTMLLVWAFLILGIIALAHHIKCHKSKDKKSETN